MWVVCPNFWAHRFGRNIDQSTSSAGPAQAAFNRLKMGTHQGEEQAAPEMLVEKVHQPLKLGFLNKRSQPTDVKFWEWTIFLLRINEEFERDYIEAAVVVFGKGIDLGWFAHATTINICGPKMRKCSTKVEWNNKIVDLTKSNANYDGQDSKVLFWWRWLLGSFFLRCLIFGGAQERHVGVEPNDAGLGSRDLMIWGLWVFLWLPLWQMEGEILKKRKSTLVTSGKKRWDEWLVSSTSESKVEYMSPWHHVDGLYVYRYLWNSTQATCQSMAASPQPAGSKWSQLVVWLMAGLCGELQYPCSWHVRLPGSEAGGEENAYIIGWLLRKWSLKKLKFRSWWSVWCTVDLKWVVVKAVKSLK